MAFITKNVAIDQGAFTGETYTGMETTDGFPTKDELRKNWCYNPLKSGFQDYNSNDFVDNGDYLEPLTLGTGMYFGEQGSEFKAGSTVYLGGFSTPVGTDYTEDGYTGGTIMGNIGGSTANYQYLGMVEPDTWYYVSALMKITDVSLLDNTQINNIFFIQNASYMGSDSFGLGIQTSGRLAITYNPASSPLNNQQVNTLSSDTFTLANNVWYLVTLAWNSTLLIGIGIIERDGERVVVKGARCISNVFRFSSGHQLRATFGSNQNITCKWIKSYIGAVPNETFTRGLTKLASVRFTPMSYNHTGNTIGNCALTSLEVVADKTPYGIVNIANNFPYTNPASGVSTPVTSLPYRGAKFTSHPALSELGVQTPESGDKFIVDFIVYFDGHKPTTNDVNLAGKQYYHIGGINYSFDYQDTESQADFRGANTVICGDLENDRFLVGHITYSNIGTTNIHFMSFGSINLTLNYTKPYIFRLYYPQTSSQGKFEILDYDTREVLGTWSGQVTVSSGSKAKSIIIGTCGVSVDTQYTSSWDNITTVSNLIYLGVDTYTNAEQNKSSKILKYLSDYSCVYQNSIGTWTSPGNFGGTVASSTLSGGYFQNNTGSMHLSGLKLASDNASDFPLTFGSTTHLYNYPFSIGNDEWVHYRYTITLDTSISITNNAYRALASIVGAKIDSNSSDLFEIALVFMQTSSSAFSLHSWLNINGADATHGKSTAKVIQSGISYDTLKGEAEDITILWDVIFNKDGNVLQTMCYDMNGSLIGSSAYFNEIDFNTSENSSGTKNAIYVFNPYVGVHPRAQVLNSNPSYSYGNIGIIRQLAITHNHYYESL